MNEQDLKRFWINVSLYYQKKLPDEIIKMYVYDCKNIALYDLKKAFEAHRQSKKANFMPLPAVLKNFISPPIDETAEANAIVEKIMECISGFGWTNPEGAEKQMGEMAWSVVNGFGGWRNLCYETISSATRAQLRDLAKSKIVRMQQGRGQILPGSDVKAVMPNNSENNKNNALIELDGHTKDFVPTN